MSLLAVLAPEPPAGAEPYPAPKTWTDQYRAPFTAIGVSNTGVAAG